eukprot:417937-Amphidinium_carterae.1
MKLWRGTPWGRPRHHAEECRCGSSAHLDDAKCPSDHWNVDLLVELCDSAWLSLPVAILAQARVPGGTPEGRS